MNIQWLRIHVDELKTHLAHFKLMLHQLEDNYQRSLHLCTDPDLQSTLMEQYSRHVDRQQKAVEAMGILYQNALDQLNALEAGQD